MTAGFGAMMSDIARASIIGRVSTFDTSSSAFKMTSSCSCAFSGCVISRPRNRTVNFTLWPASMNRRAAFTLKAMS